MDEDPGLTGRVAIITGGSEGIGKAAARDEAQVQAMVAQVVERWGTVDILVNNAGTSAAARFEDVSDATWDGDLGLKLYGAIYCARAVLPHMKAAGGGRIINVTTPGGKAPGANSLPTSLARAAPAPSTSSTRGWVATCRSAAWARRPRRGT